MTHKAYWAYAFSCDKPIAVMRETWNCSGPWQWEERDSHWYGDYLNSRPLDGVRVRIHEPNSLSAAAGSLESKYTALIQIEDHSAATRADIDIIVRRLLTAVAASAPEEIEPYD